MPCELSKLIIPSNSLVWSRHLLTDSYTMSSSYPKHILTFNFNFSHLSFDFNFSNPHVKKWVNFLCSENMIRKSIFEGIPVLSQWVMNLNIIHEDVALSLGITQWVKYPTFL